MLTSMITRRQLCRAGLVVIIFLIVLLLSWKGSSETKPQSRPYDPDLFAKVDGSIFEGFDNETGTSDGSTIVPNHVHFLFFDKTYIPYVHAVCVLAAFKNQQPEKIIFHTNVIEFTGTHWIKIRDTLGSVLEIRNITLPNEIFGQKFSKNFHLWHASDVTRIRILMEHGGIFVDNDSYIVRSLDPFRKYEMAIGITDGNKTGTQVLIANKDARFLKLWLELYRDYKPDDWYYNAGEKPVEEVLRYRPELVHAVKTLFGVHTLSDRLYIWDRWETWKKYYSIHLIIRHRNYMDTIWNNYRWPDLDETNICDYPKPFGVMAREIYSDFCRKMN
ncbi:uncharacterized protein LOC110829414 isoform X2 [Zootermopsis nevadensis]|uniref:uncharacterized protein LOC110829414 isoform X2 n=1 Tax=Zootermopsis nevadensis TaxID=136037 RepID=UPI000B8EBE2C|nr:uncharacterized protein LOC110829414 isoform X2 [Zootermopsis nevadensis]XP_021918800.1 uncharacterized protein LOC110829414 isoform X2 [Zootermopsis nevadensis]